MLVTGSGGLLGGRLAALLAARFEVVAAYRSAPPPPGLPALAFDLLSPGALASALDENRIDAVVHAAALADSVRCEQTPQAAELANVRTAASVARACRERHLRLIALSTDLVFAGRHPFATERDEPQPILEYGRSKRRGELAVLEAHPEACIARVALVHGRGHGGRGTASESVGWALRRGAPVRLFVDEYRTPVDPESVSEAVARLLVSEAAGYFHLGGPERISRWDLGLRTVRAQALSESHLIPTSQREAAGPPRPADTSLDSSRALRELGWRPRPLDAALGEGRNQPD